MLIKLILISSVLIGLAALGFGIRIFFSKWKKFPSTQIGHNKDMKDRKIYCPKTQDKIAQKRKNPWQGPI